MAVKNAIEHGYDEIHTSSMANFSFDLLNKEYEIYLISQSKRQIRIVPDMPELDKELRPAHNILKIFIAGFFDSLIFDRNGVS